MHRAHVECVDACIECVDARVNAHAMQFTCMRMRRSLRRCAYDAACVNAHTMQFACLLNQLNHHCLIQMIIVGSKWSLSVPNDHCRFQMIMLAKTWFKSASQLIVSSGIISLDLADEIFCWCNIISQRRRKIRVNDLYYK